jgi:S-adenosylmethionine synthetase
VTEGHPGKSADQVGGVVLDALTVQDPAGRTPLRRPAVSRDLDPLRPMEV